MHMLTGKWKIVATTALGTMDLVADFKASEDATTFTGSVFDEKNNKTYEVMNGVLNDHHISYDMVIKFGLFPFNFHLEGEYTDGGKCHGEGKAMKMEGTYEGYKLAE